MYRILLALSLFLTISLNAAAEEIVLKDGTKIVGRMTGITDDKIDVETAYGKMSVKRSDIVAISFPENSKEGAPAPPSSKKDVPLVEDSLEGTKYNNKTGKFTLTLPTDWKINPALRPSGEIIAGLSSLDNLRYLVVVEEEYSGSLESYKGLAEIQARRNLQNYEKLSESPITIDNKSAVLTSYRGTLPKADNLPVQFLSAIIPVGKSYFHITTWCVEPLFNETQSLFEKIISSYHSTGDPSVHAPESKP